MSKFGCILFVMLFALACKQDKLTDAEIIINKSIEVSGGERFRNSTVDFLFRKRTYRAIRYQNYFLLTRTTIDANDTIVDVLNSHAEFSRFINQRKIEIHDTMASKYKSSVNVVHYFSVLPYGLNDAAVKKSFLDKVKINNAEYYKIKVTFDVEGGGEDYDDVFIYWINTNTFKADYLGYSYAETDGIGYRFREALNERYIEGIRFVDYNNYKPKNKTDNVEVLDSLFVHSQLKLLSKIELENIKVDIENY